MTIEFEPKKNKNKNKNKNQTLPSLPDSPAEASTSPSEALKPDADGEEAPKPKGRPKGPRKPQDPMPLGANLGMLIVSVYKPYMENRFPGKTISDEQVNAIVDAGNACGEKWFPEENVSPEVALVMALGIPYGLCLYDEYKQKKGKENVKASESEKKS